MPSNIDKLSEISSLKEYLKENKLSYISFAQVVGIKVDILQKYISGESFPTRIDMEKIFIATEGQIQPIDFLFRYKEEFNIIEYIEEHLDLGIVCKKELAYELGISRTGLIRRLNGKYAFQKGEIARIMKLIESKKNTTS